ncbi:MAG: hypothetical protein KGY70_18280, partial [Bacteroidales bacterium]|nr:hypothetical protein [Bacteroidales bacterium]
MNLDEFKEKYPAYKNIDDDELAGALYNKFYKDKVSHSDFREKIGLSPEVMSSEPEQGILGKAKDFAGAIKDTVTGKSEPGVGLVSKQDFEAFKPDSPLKIPEIQLPGREQKKPDKARYGTGLVPDLEGKGERVESKEKTPDSEGFVHHELMGTPSWRQAESPSAFKKAINRIKDSFRISPEKSANVVALAQENGIPPHIVLEHYDELTEGLRTQPKPMELYSGLITYPIIMGLMTNPTGVIAGLSSFMAIDEIENLAVSKIKNEKYHPLGGKGLVDLAPSQLNDNAKTAIEILDFIGKGALAGKIGQVADRTVSNWWKNLSSRERGLQTLKINERVKQGDMSLGQALRERARQAKQEGRYEEQMEQFINEYVRSKRKTKARPETKTEPKPAPEPGVKPSEEVSKPGEIKILEKTQELTKPTEAPESTGRPITPSETIEPQFEQTVRAQPGKQPISGPVRL